MIVVGSLGILVSASYWNALYCSSDLVVLSTCWGKIAFKRLQLSRCTPRVCRSLSQTGSRGRIYFAILIAFYKSIILGSRYIDRLDCASFRWFIIEWMIKAIAVVYRQWRHCTEWQADLWQWDLVTREAKGEKMRKCIQGVEIDISMRNCMHTDGYFLFSRRYTVMSISWQLIWQGVQKKASDFQGGWRRSSFLHGSGYWDKSLDSMASAHNLYLDLNCMECSSYRPGSMALSSPIQSRYI